MVLPIIETSHDIHSFNVGDTVWTLPKFNTKYNKFSLRVFKHREELIIKEILANGYYVVESIEYPSDKIKRIHRMNISKMRHF